MSNTLESLLCLTLLGLCGCAAALGQTDGFPKKLKRGCDSLTACEYLYAEAQGRVARCKENTIGYIRCGDARADERLARQLLEAKQREKREERARLLENERRLQQEQIDKAMREAKAEQERREEEIKQRFEAERRRKEEARERAEAQAFEREAAAHEEKLEYLRLMTPQRRRQTLAECHREYGADACSDLVSMLLQAAGDQKEKEGLVEYNEQLKRRPPSSPAPGGGPSAGGRSQGGHSGGSGRLLCCDGTLSPTCSCSGSRRGCCSHHGGVCGCD